MREIGIGEYKLEEAGPSTYLYGKPNEQTMMLYTIIDGRQFVSCYVVTGDAHEDAKMRQSALQDLDWFIRKFWFYGCGGYDHDFPEGGLVVEKLYTCRKCGAAKKKNMDLAAVLSAARKVDEAKENGVIH